jgi:hypothetical protein
MKTPDVTTAGEMLRHSLAAIAYRCGKTLRDAPQGFVDFQAGHNVRTPVQILAHIGDLLDWALSMAQGKPAFHPSDPLPWPDEVQRFFDSLKALDDYLGGSNEIHAPAQKLLQGPIADALQHVGQLAMLRRLSGMPVRAEDFYSADITSGRVGREQAPPKYEFD